MTLQINACTDGSRDYTCYILGNDDADNAYQRTSRDTDYDVWWTLTLAGEFEDTRVDTADLPMELTADNYQTVQGLLIGAQAYGQENVTWSNWTSVGSYTSVGYGDSVDISWDYDAYTFDGLFTEENTSGWTVNPALAIQIQDDGYLQLPDDAQTGDTGDSARFTFTYSDITITAEGYDDIVISGDTVTTRWTIKEEGGWTSGTSKAVDLLAPIMEATGLDLQGVVEQYLPSMKNISFSLSFDAFELVYPEDIDAFLVELDAEDEEVLASLQEYIDRVDAAEEIINNSESTAEEMEDALDDAKKAANRATKAAEGYTKATAAADELQDRVATMTATVESLTATEEEEVVEEEADTSSSSTSSDSSSSTGVVVGIIIVIVVIVVVVVVVVVTGKKKKK